MGILLIFLILFPFLVALVVIVAVVNDIFKKSKWGIVIYSLLALLVFRILGMNYIDQWTISKKDVVADFAFMDLELKDDFKIIEMDVSGMPERNQETEIRVSKEDKERMINVIKNAPDFIPGAKSQISYDLQEKGIKVWFNFEEKDLFSRESWLYFNGVPTRIFLSVYKEGNLVEYQRFKG